jgi:hypothetical protein
LLIVAPKRKMSTDQPKKESYFSSNKESNPIPGITLSSENKSESEINDVHDSLIPKKEDNPMKEINYNKKVIYVKIFVCVFVAFCVPFNALINFFLLMGNEHSKMSFVVTHMFNVFLPLSELFIFIGIILYLGCKFFRGSKHEKRVLEFFNEV